MNHFSLEEISTNLLIARLDARTVSKKGVEQLRSSIAQIGIVHPLRVRRRTNAGNSDSFEVTAGRHRLQAARDLNLKSVPCIIVDENDIDAEIAMLDENLCRAEMGVGDRDKAVARRKALYLTKHPESAAGQSQARGMNASLGRNVKTKDVPTFVSETAKITGRSQSHVKQSVERGEKISADVVEMLRGTALDSQSYYNTLKNLAPMEQVETTKHKLEEDRKAARQSRKGRSRRILVTMTEAQAAEQKREGRNTAHRKNVAIYIVNLLDKTGCNALAAMIDDISICDLYQPLIDAIDNVLIKSETDVSKQVCEYNIDDPDVRVVARGIEA